MQHSFPKHFLWGASTSAYQVEGNNYHNDWWEWEAKGEIEPSASACDHYHKYNEDFQLASRLNHNSHRMGIEWSRVEKKEGIWDEDEWDHYKDVIQSLKSNKLEPVVTLNHFTIPLWFRDKGGWLNQKSPELFSRFAEKAAKEFGPDVKYWITFNEPNILAILSFFYGKWPPFIKDFSKAILVLRNMLFSHAIAYNKIKKCYKDNNYTSQPLIGIAKAVTAFHPKSRASFIDRYYTHLRNNFHNHAFINSAVRGRVLLPGSRKVKLPFKKTIDFIGLNYYFRQFIHGVKPYTNHPFGEVSSHLNHPDGRDTTDMGWEIYPEGIYEIVKDFSKYHIPLIIAENGLATTDDSIRKKYIKDHLFYLDKAIRDGSPLIGYLHWSLLDNFEWAEGYSKRFGLIDIDFTSKKRTVKDSAHYLASVIESGVI